MPGEKKLTQLTEAHINKLTREALADQKKIDAKDPGERGLYLRISSRGKRVWYSVSSDPVDPKKKKWNALGEYPAVGLADAREKHRAVREQVRQGNNPVAVKREKRRQEVQKRAERAQEEVRRKTETLSALINSYTPHAPASFLGGKVKRVFATILDKPIKEISRQEINRLSFNYRSAKTGQPARTYSNSAVNMLRPLLRWAHNQYEWVPESLGLIKNPFSAEARGEHLTDDMIQKLLPRLRASKGHGTVCGSWLIPDVA